MKIMIFLDILYETKFLENKFLENKFLEKT